MDSMISRSKPFQLTCIGFFVALFLSGCSGDKGGGQSTPEPLPVLAAMAVQKDVPIELPAIGNVEAYTTVSVKSQVAGQIIQIHFTEGQEVKKGDLLFTLDPRPFEAALQEAEARLKQDLAQTSEAEANLTKYQAQVNEAEANLEKDATQVKEAEATLARDQAQAENAALELERYKSLLERGVVAVEQYNQYHTTAKALEATVQADKAGVENARAGVVAGKAAVENAKATVLSGEAALDNTRAAVEADRAAVAYAKVQLGYCFIRAPMEGRTGSLLVRQGSVLKANDTDLVVINQIRPIYVDFSVAEKFLPEIRRHMAAGQLRTLALISDEKTIPEEGILTFVDNTVDKATGTILLKGTYKNEDKRLWPGQFVNVILRLAIQRDAVIVPSQAVQAGQGGDTVFVIKPDLTVESRPVRIGHSDQKETVIEKGIQPGEKVVTDGQLRLTPGAKVEIKTSLLPPGSKEKDL